MSDSNLGPDLYQVSADDPAAARLLEMMARVEDRISALDADSDDDDPDAGLQNILAALCHADEAPLEWRSIGGRVERGTLTWQHFWARPREEGPAGTALVAAALDESTRGIMDRLQAEESQVVEAAEEKPGRAGGAGGRDAGPGDHRP